MGKTKQSDADANPPSTALAKTDQTVLAPASVALARRSKKTILVVLGSALTYDPIPLTRPIVRADFNQASTSVRILEGLRYIAAVAEYRVGPNGWFRAWVFSWLGVLLLILVPLLVIGAVAWVFVPVMMGMESVFQSVANIAHSLQAACGSLLQALLYILCIVAILGALLAGLGVLAKTIRR